MALEWYWWVIIGVSVLVVGVVLYMLLAGGDEEAAEEKMEAKPEQLFDLSDDKVVAALQKDGVTLMTGETARAVGSIPAGSGVQIFFSEACDDIMDTATLEDAAEWFAKLSEKPAETKEGDEKAEEKEEKRLRQDAEDAAEGEAEEGEELEYVGLSMKGTKAGKCTFQMALAAEWEADWEEPKTYPEEATVVEFGIEVTKEKWVAPEAEEGDKKEEKKEDAEEGEKEVEKEE